MKSSVRIRFASVTSLNAIVEWSIHHGWAAAGFLAVILGFGVYAATRLPIDAVPDISTMQVSVLTEAPGRSALEVERIITFPIENALNGVPGMTELRSVSRAGISSVTVIFDDGTDPWFARQLVLERVRQVEGELPEGAGRPELAPLSTGLGEIYQFVVRSDHHSPMQLRTLLDWEIVPRLRSVPGVIEINTMGGKLKEFHVRIDPTRMHAYGLTIGDVATALRHANVNVGGGYLDRGAESFTLRGVGMLRGEQDIANVVVKNGDDGRPVLVRHVGKVLVASALPHGLVTRDGEQEVVVGVVMMLLGANSRDVVYAVRDRIDEIRYQLPPGVEIEVVYDRADFVARTLQTVATNLMEGALVVTLVLVAFLGTFRGALVVVLGIPASMAVALLGMIATGTTGDLMSLGAIDFGFLVDGPIVILEAVVGARMGVGLLLQERAVAQARALVRVVRPVAFSVAIILIVYVPLLTLEGVEGKMFRPMAITMAFALLGALVYSVVILPGLVALVVQPSKQHESWIWSRIEGKYSWLLTSTLRWRAALWAGIAGTTLWAGLVLVQRGADFVPRIFEGDAVVTIRRPPSINLQEALKLDLASENVLKRYPEVITTLGMTGRAEVAIDPVGKDNTDILVRLAAPEQWQTAGDFDELSYVLKRAIESEVPSTFVSISQPIEDRTNELISGSRADVQINVFGSDLNQLRTLSEQIRHIVAEVRGTGDLRLERVLGAPEIKVVPDRERLARYGVLVEDALTAVEAARIGIPVGWVYEDERRIGVRLVQPPRSATMTELGDLFVETSSGKTVPLHEVATISESEGPPQIRRENRLRTVRVEVNLRGRDLVSWVQEARSKIEHDVILPTGYEIQWGGQFENFERASARISVVAVLVLAIVLGMLVAAFGETRCALAVFSIVPAALAGGVAGLIARDLPFSIPAAVGLIALAGVSVLNGVVLTSAVRDALATGQELGKAIEIGAIRSLRAVVTTGTVAALGFLPMALSTGAGAEVQRPLATVVVFGVGWATLLTLVLLPSALHFVLGHRSRVRLPSPRVMQAERSRHMPSR